MKTYSSNKKIPEKKFQQWVESYLQRHGVIFQKTQGGLLFTKQHQPIRFRVGISDIVAFQNGKCYFIELKTDEGTLTQTQINTFTNLRQQGFKNTIVLRPEHWRMFKLLGKKTDCDLHALIYLMLEKYNVDLIWTSPLPKSKDRSRVVGVLKNGN